MGLYLAVFDGDDELDGVEVGRYADFNRLRAVIAGELEDGVTGSKFPVFMLHPDSDGLWTPEEAKSLEQEINAISAGLRQLPPTTLGGDWQQDVACAVGLKMETLYDCFFDVDGEPLLDRLLKLAAISRERRLPILFQ